MNLTPQVPDKGYFYSEDDIKQSVARFMNAHTGWAIAHTGEENRRSWPVAATFDYDFKIKLLTIKYHP